MTYEKRYRWRHTWRDKEDDYVAQDHGRQVGRVYRAPYTGGSVVWQWFLQTDSFVRAAVRCEGGAVELIQAVEQLEGAYMRLCELELEQGVKTSPNVLDRQMSQNSF